MLLQEDIPAKELIIINWKADQFINKKNKTKTYFIAKGQISGTKINHRSSAVYWFLNSFLVNWMQNYFSCFDTVVEQFYVVSLPLHASIEHKKKPFVLERCLCNHVFIFSAFFFF